MKRIRIGIDVGGTFTHAVAIDNDLLEVISHAVTPTTHSSDEGVAKGIIDVFNILIDSLKNIQYKIVFISHSTTQATNALLEGDVSEVGIIGMGKGIEAIKAKQDTNIPKMEIAPKKYLTTYHEFLNISKGLEKEVIKNILKNFSDKNIKCVVASEAFSVDDPTNEINTVDLAIENGFMACATYQMTGLYGLKVRTRTAVINASILPKMMETADLTEKCIKESSVNSSLMIMRSDGGVMTIDEVRKRPLLTLLSGPAAGIAAALMYIRASDAIFLEVGGTSTDISVIKNGRAMIKSAHIGGHATYLKTLDSRTLGIAGGSLIAINGKKITDVGPRSAHIAGLTYICFAKPEELIDLEVITVNPKNDDPDYLALKNKEGKKFGITTTCAANYIGSIKKSDYAYGNHENLEKAFKVLENYFNKPAKDIAKEIMDKAVSKIIPAIKTLIKEYALTDKNILLIGGGGGSSAIVTYLAETLKFNFETAKKAEVISAIGAALALVRETVEKNVFSPKESDINQIYKEAQDAVAKMGADPDTIEVQIEVDSQKNILRAAATGSIEFRSHDVLKKNATEKEKRISAAKSIGVDADKVSLVASTDGLFVYSGISERKGFLNIFNRKVPALRIIDERGTVKLQISKGNTLETTGENVYTDITKVINKLKTYGDAGISIPSLFILLSRKIIDLSHIMDEEQIKTITSIELKRIKPDERIVIIAQSRQQ